MLPVSVLIPTRNCAAFVPGHLDSLHQWVALAEEVVVVDSDSTDGTVELLRAGISHQRVRFLTHPPGLYQSWNFGIQNATAKYIYFATVGDFITRHGIEHLFEVAEKFQSDVVVSKPNFINEAGAALADDRWNIDVIIDKLQVRQPALLTTAAQIIFAVTNLWGAILGSSASNLYRAEYLKSHPFPVDYGIAGDGAWGIQYVFEAKIAVTPERFSTFRQHEKTYSTADYHVESLALNLFRLAQNVAETQGKTNPSARKVLEEVRWPELEKAMETMLAQQSNLELARRQKTPWPLNPGAWRARAGRGKAQDRIDAIIDQVIAAARAQG
jgi:glycosyltransferase involved in cell wall biosynthesis